MNFKIKYLNGEIPFEAIDDFIESWGEQEETKTLREYLGLNAEEEDIWISESEEDLRRVLDEQKGMF